MFNSPSFAMTTIKTRKLGKTGIDVTELALGSWGLCAESYGKVFPEQRLRTFARAIEQGIRVFDMAPTWGEDGESEREVAEAVGTRRNEMVYITRAGLVPGEHSIDTMSIPDRDGSRIFALTEEALIATHSGAFAEARSALDRRTALLWKAAADVGTPEFRRTQAADILYYDGLLALHKGDLPAATAKASEAMRQVAANRDPRRDQQAHALLGMVDLAQKNYTNALTHFAQADPNDMYVAYHRALALQGAGRKDEAKRLFREVANYNFSSAGVALVRADAKKHAG